MEQGEDKPKAGVVSLSGQPIYQHGEPTPWAPPAGEENVEEISAHIERHLGPVDSVYHEILSDTVHIDVHIVKPTESFPFHRLVTSGMSDLPRDHLLRAGPPPPGRDGPQTAQGHAGAAAAPVPQGRLGHHRSSASRRVGEEVRPVVKRLVPGGAQLP